MRRQNLVPFPCLYMKPFELVTEIIFHYCTTPPCGSATKCICSNVHSGAAALSAWMMLLCCSLASSSFTLRKSSFLSNDHLNSRMYTVRWFLLITMPLGLRFQKEIPLLFGLTRAEVMRVGDGRTPWLGKGVLDDKPPSWKSLLER